MREHVIKVIPGVIAWTGIILIVSIVADCVKAVS